MFSTTRITASVCTILCAVASWTAYGAVIATPSSVSFSKLSDSATIQLSRDGAPLPASAVHSARVMIDDSNYSHQFRLEIASGGNAAVTIAPDPVYCEKGSFDLQIQTSSGTAHVEVLTPLDDLASSIETRAAVLGVPVEEMKRILTLPDTPLPAFYTITLPEWITLGQTFRLPVPIQQGVSRTWLVNGQPVPVESNGGLAYVFTQPGANAIAFEDRDAAGRIMAYWRSTVDVRSEPPIAVNAGVRQPLLLNAPEGYSDYLWLRPDGEVVSTSSQVTATYDRPGTFHIHLVASQPTGDSAFAFRSLDYTIDVK